MLPFIKTDNREFNQLQTKWASELNPLLAKPLSDANILKGIKLVSGDNVINHKLGRTMQGWIISDITDHIGICRSAPFNDLTLTLNSTGTVTVDLVVF